MPAAPYQPLSFPFSNQGEITKLDPVALQPGQYQKIVNMVSLQEGSIQTRNGYKHINTGLMTDNEGNQIVFIHTLGRIAFGGPETNNFFYLGSGIFIYRIPAGVANPAPGTPVAQLGVANFGHNWQQLQYRKFSSGLPYSYFATPSLMLKDVLTDNQAGLLGLLQKWGIDRPWVPARTSIAGSLPTSTFAGNCSTQLFTVTRTGGAPFNIGWNAGTTITINAVQFAITAVQDQDHLTLQTSAGYQNGVSYSVIYATTPGPNSTITDYKYVYTLRNPITGQESNPSMLQLNGITAFNQSIFVTVNSDTAAPQLPLNIAAAVYSDPQIVGTNSIAIYRSGGSFSDAIYRLVGYATPATTTTTGTASTNGLAVTVSFFPTNVPAGNPITINGVLYIIDLITGPGTLTLTTSAGVQTNVTYSVTVNSGADVFFTDTASDTSIAGAPQAQFDNDPPVTSTLPIAFSATIASFASGTGAANSPSTLVLNVVQGYPAGVTQLSSVLRPGTVLSVGSGATQEFVLLQSIPANNQVRVWFQIQHNVGEIVSTGSIANQNCTLECLAFDSLFLAGDPNNPTTLYKSKTGQPESFPVANLEDGSPGSIEVGTPSNPIVAITEFNGQVVSLNKNNIFLVNVWNGAMLDPVLTPAQRGLYGTWAWCKADNEIWYVSYDGVYSWSGAQSTKRSEQIDPIFKGETVNGFPPISMNTTPDSHGVSDLQFIQLYYYRNEIYMYYRDVNANVFRARYHLIYNRWSHDIVGFFPAQTTVVVPLAQLFAEDNGNFYLATIETPSGGSSVGFFCQDDMPVTSTGTATTDGFSNVAQSNGTPIFYQLFTGFFNMGLPTLQKQFGDIILELQDASDGNPADTITVQTFYDFSTIADPVDTFVIPQAPGRRRVPLSLKSGSAQEAYAIAFFITGQSGVPVTFYSLTFNFLPLEQIQIGRALDWDNLGYPYDKKLQQLTIEFDTQGSNVALNLDIMSGIAAGAETQAVDTFTLTSPASTLAIGPVRAQANYPIPNDLIAKMVRLRPTVSATNFKVWNYNFDFIKYPPDKVLFTDWEDLGYMCDKLFREVTLTIDTASIDCQVDVWLDGVMRQTFFINTSTTDRDRILTFASDVLGKTIRMVFTPGVGGKCQLFNYKYNWIGDACAILHWDSYETTLGYNLFKFLKQITVEYVCDSSITFKVYRDLNQLLLSTTLPRHDFRNTERFYLPPISALGYVNKSKVYRFTIDPCNTCAPFKLYRDGTRAEFMPIGGDQRQSYQLTPLFEPIPIDVPAPAG